METQDQTENLKWGFDLTDFGSPRNFQDILIEYDISEEPEIVSREGKFSGKKHKYYLWKGPDIILCTSENPFSNDNDADTFTDETGYASYMALEGKPEKVKQFASDLDLNEDVHVKGESPGSHSYCHIPDQVALDFS